MTVRGVLVPYRLALSTVLTALMAVIRDLGGLQECEGRRGWQAQGLP